MQEPTDRAPGSSPLVRGSDIRGVPVFLNSRFIPARAGIGGLGSDWPLSAAVHPRSYGDRFLALAFFIVIRGSSPLVRGSECADHRGAFDNRFIPARAGIGTCPTPRTAISAVHPRSCGDRYRVAMPAPLPFGSSPLVRGSVLYGAGTGNERRFIPARAGIGPITGLGVDGVAVHPRSCGDRSSTAAINSRAGGSSPLVRGSGWGHWGRSRSCRFIPARAGIGVPLPIAANIDAVHPRSCGDRDGEW